MQDQCVTITHEINFVVPARIARFWDRRDRIEIKEQACFIDSALDEIIGIIVGETDRPQQLAAMGKDVQVGFEIKGPIFVVADPNNRNGLLPG